MSLPSNWLQRLLRFARAGLTGAAATVADVLMVGLLVGVCGLSPQIANVPALLVGAAVQFFGNRHFTFAASAGSLRRQMLRFALVEAVTLVLYGGIYALAATRLATEPWSAMALRLAVGALVFLGWSYPMWKWAFRPQQRAAAVAPAAPE